MQAFNFLRQLASELLYLFGKLQSFQKKLIFLEGNPDFIFNFRYRDAHVYMSRHTHKHSCLLYKEETSASQCESVNL